MLRTSSSTTRIVRPAKAGSLACSCSSSRRLSAGSRACTRCRYSDVSSSSRSGELASLTTTVLAYCLSRVSSLRVRSRPVWTMTGTSARVGSALTSPRAASKGPAPGSPRSSTTHVDRLLAQRRERLLGRRRGADLDVVAAEQLGDRVALGRVVLDQQQRAHRALGELLDALQHPVQRVGAPAASRRSRPPPSPCCRAAARRRTPPAPGCGACRDAASGAAGAPCRRRRAARGRGRSPPGGTRARGPAPASPVSAPSTR